MVVATRRRAVLGLASGVGLIALYICLTDGEIREERYDSYREALASIDRGWLPTTLPRSATQIHEWHDLDTNARVGSFRFDPRERGDFESALHPGLQPAIRIDRDPSFARTVPLDPTEAQIREGGFGLYTAQDLGFAVNWNSGIAYFWSSIP